ncbi:hypothetical protein D3C87_2089650 [compost metagenome]
MLTNLKKQVTIRISSKADNKAVLNILEAISLVLEAVIFLETIFQIFSILCTVLQEEVQEVRQNTADRILMLNCNLN